MLHAPGQNKSQLPTGFSTRIKSRYGFSRGHTTLGFALFCIRGSIPLRDGEMHCCSCFFAKMGITPPTYPVMRSPFSKRPVAQPGKVVCCFFKRMALLGKASLLSASRRHIIRGSVFNLKFAAYSTERCESVSPPTSVAERPWSPDYRRIGAVGFKLGMMSHYDEWGKRYPVTVIHVCLTACTKIGSWTTLRLSAPSP